MVFVKSFLSAWIRILKVNDDKILPFWDPRLAGRLHHHGTRPVLLRGTGVWVLISAARSRRLARAVGAGRRGVSAGVAVAGVAVDGVAVAVAGVMSRS